MVTGVPLLDTGPKFSAEEFRQIQKLFRTNKDFRKMFIKLQNARMLGKISMGTWGTYVKQALEEHLSKKTKEDCY